MIPPHLASLNERQQSAALHTDGPLLIVAGAGTGKTRTLTHRIVHLIKQGNDPRSILAVTFTNKAAAEMRERIADLLREQGDTETAAFPMVRTFHALGVYLMRKHADRMGLNKYFTILDRQDSMSMIKRAMKERDIDPKQWEPRKILGAIGRAKNAMQSIDEYQNTADGPQVSIAAQVWRRFEEMKRDEGAKDFDDLLLDSYHLLRQHEDLRTYYRKLWKYIHVDEYQDTNDVQHHLLLQLIEPTNNNICAVGDADQTIYTWRGATMRNMMQFDIDFPGATTVILSQNYRSTPTILQAAHAVIDKNTVRIPKELIPVATQDGRPILSHHALSGEQEAAWIVEQLWKEHKNHGRSFSDMAILYRTNFQSRLLEEACLHTQLPYKVSGVKFFDRKEVKDVLSYIFAALNRDSLSHLTRALQFPKRGIGKVSLGKILAGAYGELAGKAREGFEKVNVFLDRIESLAHEKAPSELLTLIVHESGIRDELLKGSADDHERLANIQELVSFSTRYDVLNQTRDDIVAGAETSYLHNLEVMLEHISLMSEQDGMSEEQDAVRLMTVHAAKGLEFDIVVIAGLEQGLFPSDMGGDEKRDPEEERRLMYVAITRAKEQLILSHAHMRRIFGQQNFQHPSEFLLDVPQDLVQESGMGVGSDQGGGDMPTMYLEW